jgi:alginate O-acetyltransferase complex protein AlgI
MVFSSPIFLFVFLPVVLLGCVFQRMRLRNYWLLGFSLIFYAWGEVAFVFLMLGSTLINYFLGRWIDRESDASRRKWAVALAVGLNVGLLAFFKYANFMVDNLNWMFTALGASPVHVASVRLPIGISFFTFHAVSYVVDIYRRKWAPAKSPDDVALYIFFFPQLIAGPILRWNAIAPQIASRIQTAEQFAQGARRFIMGLAKKVLIANVVAVPADQIFKMCSDGQDLSPALAWLGALCYTLQIYFDFSGYSDMAIGLGKMFGFEFMENFNYPYISQSIRDFWRRWHISLSSWFRDYLYIPLGGNRCSTSRNHLNLLLVFLLCGLWHGASWTFVVWGLYHGFFIMLEHTGFARLLGRVPGPLRHLYALLVVVVGWVIFRASTFLNALAFLGNMIGITSVKLPARPLESLLSHQVACSIIAGIAFSTPIWGVVERWVGRKLETLPPTFVPVARATGAVLRLVLLVALLVISSAWLAGGTYNPFIYFRF